jgi:hypothetical protein
LQGTQLLPGRTVEQSAEHGTSPYSERLSCARQSLRIPLVVQIVPLRFLLNFYFSVAPVLVPCITKRSSFVHQLDFRRTNAWLFLVNFLHYCSVIAFIFVPQQVGHELELPSGGKYQTEEFASRAPGEIAWQILISDSGKIFAKRKLARSRQAQIEKFPLLLSTAAKI